MKREFGVEASVGKDPYETIAVPEIEGFESDGVVIRSRLAQAGPNELARALKFVDAIRAAWFHSRHPRHKGRRRYAWTSWRGRWFPGR